jgi:hypothetical protein
MRSVLNVCLHDCMVASVYIDRVYNGIVMPGAVHHKCYMLEIFESAVRNSGSCSE